MAKTFKDRLKAKQEAKFIGRSEHLTVFNNNLKATDPYAIINIYGQGGVGKSYLSQQYKTIAEENNCLTAYTDEDTKSILEWMERVAQQFKNQEAELSDFDKNYKTYLQETKKLEADPEKPKGTLGGFMKSLTKGAIKEVKKLPGAELIGGFIDEDGISSAVSEWADFARKKIGNKDEVELVLEPLKVLTPLFWKGITKHAADKKLICFFIDTFEETDTVLETWLLDVLNDKYGDIPPNILLIIAGRDPLSTNRWSAFTELTQPIALEPFTEYEADTYFNSHGIFDPAIKADISHLSGRLPVLMAWLTEAAKSGKGGVQDACETAVERFLKWVVDAHQRHIALAAALPRKLNQDIIECFLPDKAQCKAYFDWLCKQPFVLRRGDYWAYHNVVRDQMLRYVRTRSPKEWVNQHQALTDYYEMLQHDLELDEDAAFEHKTWLAYEQERLYHALCAKPDKNIPIAIASVVKKWMTFGLSSYTIFGETLHDAGNDNHHDIVKGWGLRITTAIEELKTENYTILQQLIEDILQKDYLKEQELLAYLYYLGSLFLVSTKNNYDKAIGYLEKSIINKPNYYEALYYFGFINNIKGNNEKAIEYLHKAIDIKPDDHEAFYTMGNAYYCKPDFNKAIECYQKAIDFKPDKYEAFYWMGSAYDAKSDYDKAIESYQKAIDIKPNYHEAFCNMGSAYSDKGDYDKAIQSYQKVIAFKPDYHEAYFNMGKTYYNLDNKDKSIEYFQKSIDIKSDYLEAFNNLGIVYLKNGENTKAIEYFLKVIEINPDSYEAFYCLGLIYTMIDNYAISIEYCQKAIIIKPDYCEAYSILGLCHIKFGNINEAEPILLKAIELGDMIASQMKLGHIYLCKNEEEKAVKCYQTSLSHFENKADFWSGMKDDYQYLAQYGITEAYYKTILEKIE